MVTVNKAQMACHEKGKTTGLTLNKVLERCYRRNELPENTEKWTDVEIAQFVNSEFTTTSINPAEVSHRRATYNAGTGNWNKRGPAREADGTGTGDRPFSWEYNSKGEQLPPRQVKTRLVSGTISEDQVRQIVQEELAEFSPVASSSPSATPANAISIKDVHEVVNQWATTVKFATKQDVAEIVQHELAKRPNITIIVPDRHEVTLPGGTVHKSFQVILRKVQAGVPILLVGPAGSGKTHLAKQVAEALGKTFTFNSMSEGVSESSLLGRTLPDEKGNWTYRPAPFVTTYQTGGVHLLDEIDAADPNLLVQINAAIANGQLSIPFADSAVPIKRHKDSVIIAAANTFGNGADRQYVGRNQLDSATLNRFLMGTVEVGYDKDLEHSIAKAWLPGTGGEIMSRDLLNWAWKTRSAIEANKLRRILSTRNIEDAAKLMRVGDTMADVKRSYFAGWSQEEIARCN